MPIRRRHLAFARSRELAADHGGVTQADRLGVGVRSRGSPKIATTSTFLRALSRSPLELRDSCGRYSRAVERPDRSRTCRIASIRGTSSARTRKRYLFLSGGDRVRLTDDGLATAGNVEHRLRSVALSEDWVVETFAPEGPKLLKHGDYFYMILAVGGTAGPPTGHMVIAARSRSIDGPWEHRPHNPVVRAQSASEKWSVARSCDARRRAGSELVDGLSRLRDRLLDARTTNAARPGSNGPTTAGFERRAAICRGRSLKTRARLDQCRTAWRCRMTSRENKFGAQWGFYDPGANEMERVRYENGVLVLAGEKARRRTTHRRSRSSWATRAIA